MEQQESEVVHFVQPQASEAGKLTVDHNKPALNIGTLKYTKKKRITDAENEGVLIFTTDTGEFYVGTGYDTFIKKVSDVFIGKRSDFPGTGLVNKIYLAVDERAIYYWDKIKYARFAEVNTALFQDGFIVDNIPCTKFHLTKIPLDYVIAMNINGITYFPDDFTYDEINNTVIWQNTSDDGFEITNSKVVFEYAVLKDIENVNIVANSNVDSDSKKWSASIDSDRNVALSYGAKTIVRGGRH